MLEVNFVLLFIVPIETGSGFNNMGPFVVVSLFLLSFLLFSLN